MTKTTKQSTVGPALLLLGLCLALAPVAQAAESDLSSTHTAPAASPMGSVTTVTVGYANAGPETAGSAYINSFLPNPGGFDLLWEVMTQEGDGYQAIYDSAAGTDTLGNTPGLFHDDNYCDNLLFQLQRTDDDQEANPIEGLDPGVTASFSYGVPVAMENPNVGDVAITTPPELAQAYFGEFLDVLAAAQKHTFGRTGCEPLVGDEEDPVCVNAEENCWGTPIGLLEAAVEGKFELVNDGSEDPADATLGCNPLVGFTPGNIALLRRGVCEFGDKGFNAELAGATAVFMVNDGRCSDFPASDQCIINMAAGALGDLTSIPIILVSQADGEPVITAVEEGTEVRATYGAGKRMGFQGYAFLSEVEDEDPNGNDDDSWTESSIVEASDPPVSSFTYAPTDVTVGTTVQFTDTSTGSPTSWMWDFGDGTTSDMQNPTHEFAAADDFTVSLMVMNAAGSSTSMQDITVILGQTLTEAYFVAAAALAEGAEGSFFQTDFDINNAGSAEAMYAFLWLPRNENNSDVVPTATVSLDSGASVRVENVLASVFELEAPAVGSVVVLSNSPDLKVLSRTYNLPQAKVSGTFGQAIPGVHEDDLIMANETRRVTYMSQNDDLRANLGCVNATDAGLRINIGLYGNDGSNFENLFMDLAPLSNNQISRIFRDYAPTDGYVVISSETIDAEFFCYGSVLDNGSNDPTTILPAMPSHASIYYVSAAALAEGAEGSFFQTDVDVNNAGTTMATYRLMWFPRGADNSTPQQSEEMTLDIGKGVRYENVLENIFNLEAPAVGAVGISANSPQLIVESRTYNVPQAKISGTFGQAIPGVQEDMLIGVGTKKRIIFMTEDDDFRANLGCINGSGATPRVNIALYNDSGSLLETKTMDLLPWSNNQISKIFKDYAPTNGYADVWTDTVDSTIYCYGSMVDNGSNDPTTILPQ